MRSYKKVYFKSLGGGYPAFQYYANLGEVPGQQPDAIFAFETLKKDIFVQKLNEISFLYITVWGDPDSVPPSVGFAEPAINLLSGLFPFVDYEEHQKN